MRGLGKEIGYNLVKIIFVLSALLQTLPAAQDTMSRQDKKVYQNDFKLPHWSHIDLTLANHISTIQKDKGWTNVGHKILDYNLCFVFVWT